MAECLFCRIVRGEIPAERVFESETVLAFKDIHPQAPTHILFIPKTHVARLNDISPSDMGVVGDIHRAVLTVADRLKGVGDGFRLVVNNGSDAGQAVDHLHYHFLAGRRLGWPPG